MEHDKEHDKNIKIFYAREFDTLFETLPYIKQ